MSSPNFFSRSSLTDEPLVRHQVPFNSPKRRLEVDISSELLFFNETRPEPFFFLSLHARRFRIVLKRGGIKFRIKLCSFWFLKIKFGINRELFQVFHPFSKKIEEKILKDFYY